MKIIKENAFFFLYEFENAEQTEIDLHQTFRSY